MFQKLPIHETGWRSLVKSITFRIIVVASDTAVIYIVTRRLDATVGLVILTNFSSTILYFLHERVWNRIKWGRQIVK